MFTIDNYLNQSMRLFADNFLIKLRKGNLHVTYPNNQKRIFNGEQEGQEADIKFNNYKLFTKLFRKGSIGFAESYMDGDFETNNLSKLLMFGYENEADYITNKKTSIIKPMQINKMILIATQTYTL